MFELNKNRNDKLSHRLWLVIPLFFITLIFFTFLNGYKGIQSLALFDEDQELMIKEWESQNYSKVINITDSVLLTRPLNNMALSLGGFSRFYLAISQIDDEYRTKLLDYSIIQLRKSLLRGKNPIKQRVHYILGKAYYYKGHFYSDLSAYYLELTLKENFIPEDIYEFLGLTYKDLGKYNKSIDFLKMALKFNDTDLLNKAIGQALKDNADFNSALYYLRRAVELSDDDTIKENCLFLQGEIYLGENEFQEAEKVYSEILLLDNENADAHFYLGEVYQNKNDYIQARSEWRKALRADPYHELASKRLKYR